MTVLSCFAVVTLHANGVFHLNPQSGFLWIDVSFWHHLFIFGAPAFFMISGATLLEYRKRYDTKTYFVKRFQRAVIPFIFWSLLAFLVHCIFEGKVSFKEVILLPLHIFACDFMSIYWFFMAIFFAYLFVPAMSLWTEKRKLLLFLLTTFFVIESLYPFFSNLIGFTVCSRIAFPYVSGAAFYMLLGYYVNKYDISNRKCVLIYLSGIASFIICWSHSLAHSSIPLWGGYYSPLCISYTTSVFLFVKQRDFRHMPPWCCSIVSWVKPHTLGVYLIHGFITDILAVRYNWPISSPVYRLLGPFAIIFICVWISKIMKRTPILKKVI